MILQIQIGEIRDSSSACNKECSVLVLVDAKAWRKARDKGRLGQVYGIDISNAVYHASKGKVKAYHPVVDDKQRAKGNIKRIELRYYWNEAKAV